MEDLYEIRVSDITAPRLKDEFKINVGQCRKMLSEFESSEFESFILEWLKFCRYKNEANIKLFKIGSTGDEGIDIYISRESSFEVVQCKRYKTALTLPTTRKIIIKILWYLCINKDGYPNKIFISSIRGLNNVAAKFASNSEELKKSIIDNSKSDLTDLGIKYDNDQFVVFTKYLSGFSFEKLEITDIDVIIQEYYKSDMSGFRFSNKRYEFKRVEPDKSEVDNQLYLETIQSLLSSEKASIIETIVSDAKLEYYSALQLEATCNYLFGNDSEFDKILQNIRISANNELLKDHKNNKEKYLAVREKAIETNVDNSYLSYELHMVNSMDKCGACHILTNKGDIHWND